MPLALSGASVATPPVTEVLADLASAVSALRMQVEQQGKVQSSLLQQLSVLQQCKSAPQDTLLSSAAASGKYTVYGNCLYITPASVCYVINSLSANRLFLCVPFFWSRWPVYGFMTCKHCHGFLVGTSHI